MFRKEYVFDKPNFYENILKNTYEKKLFSGYIFTPYEKRFCGKIMGNEMQIYCTDFLLQASNVLIKMKKNDNGTTHISMAYSFIQWFMLIFIISFFGAIAIVLYASGIWWSIIAYVFVAILYVYFVNWIFELYCKKIIDVMSSLQS